MSSHPNELLAASSKIANSGLVLYAKKGATINRIRSTCRRHKMKHGLHLVIVDHIGLVDVDDSRANAVQRVSEMGDLSSKETRTNRQRFCLTW